MKLRAFLLFSIKIFYLERTWKNEKQAKENVKV